jgi:hypothetical protein
MRMWRTVDLFDSSGVAVLFAGGGNAVGRTAAVGCGLTAVVMTSLSRRVVYLNAAGLAAMHAGSKATKITG